MPNELEVRPDILTAAQVRAQVNLIQEVMAAVMRRDTHYGVIPGCQKPSLYKPGAEKLLVTFRIAAESVVEDLSTPDEARYRVTVRGTAINHGLFLGSGVGECSSNEEKFRWRGTVCQAEFDAAPDDRKRLKYKRDGTTIQQVRTNHADVANTVLKMADKRAYVALALKTTAASDIFTQDIEDLPDEVRESVADDAPAKPPLKEPQRKAASGGTTQTFIPADFQSKTGETKGKPWTKYAVKSPEGTYYSTFDEGLADVLNTAFREKRNLAIIYTTDGKYNTVTDAQLT